MKTPAQLSKMLKRLKKFFFLSVLVVIVITWVDVPLGKVGFVLLIVVVWVVELVEVPD